MASHKQDCSLLSKDYFCKEFGWVEDWTLNPHELCFGEIHPTDFTLKVYKSLASAISEENEDFSQQGDMLKLIYRLVKPVNDSVSRDRVKTLLDRFYPRSQKGKMRKAQIV